MVIHIYVLLIPILLLLTAMFAASEAALFSLSQSQLETLKETRPGTYQSIFRLIKRPETLLSTLIVGSECLNILLGIFVTSLLELNFESWDPKVLILVSVLLSSALLLTVSEILPKIIAFRLPVLTATLLVTPITAVHFLLTPLRRVFLGVSRVVINLFKIPLSAPEALTEKDLLTLVELGAESGSLDRREKQMIYNVFNFSDLPVAGVMTPWKNVFSIPDNLSVSQVMDQVRQKTFSRIPVVHSDGHIVGILYTKELLKLLLASDLMNAEDAMKRAIFPPYFVSTHKKVSKLFREFKVKKVHIAIVVDEYGRHLGVVTLEDVLNSLFQTQRKAEAVNV